VRRVLLTFGGTDENNLSAKVLEGILPECEKAELEIDVVVGSGFRHHKDLNDVIQASEYKKINYVPCTNRISDFMINADIAITSGGRTVYELVALKVPTIVVCQNERETTHSFASSEHGVINLGLCHRVEKKEVFDAFSKVLKNKKLRETMKDKMMAVDLGAGKARVIGEIIKLLQEYDCE
jgi:spore coat polysaccharide biosynthesis predicted glycosyltransferase SpsG